MRRQREFIRSWRGIVLAVAVTATLLDLDSRGVCGEGPSVQTLLKQCNFQGGLIVYLGDNAETLVALADQCNNDRHVGLGATRYQLFACATGPQASVARVGDNEVAKPSGGKKKAKGKKSLDNPPERRPTPRWAEPIPLQVRAMVLGGQTLFVAGAPDFFGAADTISADDNPYYIRSPRPLAEQDAAFAGKRGASLWAMSASDGKELSEYKLESPPVFDGMISANGRLFIATMDGKVVCLGGKGIRP